MSLAKLVQSILRDSREFGLRLPVPADAGYYRKKPKPSSRVIQAYGVDPERSLRRGRSKIIGAPAFVIRNGPVTTEIARLLPYHPSIPSQAAMYQWGKDDIVVSVSPHRNQADTTDGLVVSFKKRYRSDIGLPPSLRGDAWIVIGNSGEIMETRLPPDADMEQLPRRARELLQAIRDGQSVTDKEWVRRYADWQHTHPVRLE